MNEEHIVKELNEYLKGEYMGIHAYEHFIKHTDDPSLKNELQRIQQEHKHHAAKIAERIQNLGGKAVNDNGMMLSIQEVMMNIKEQPNNNEEIIKGVLKGQEIGINKVEKIVRGDLDSTSLQLVQDNLSDDRNHINELNQFFQ